MRTNKRSTRELMGIAQILDYGLRTPAGDVAFFIIKPTNIGVLPAASITDRIQGLVKVIRTEGTVELMALNSWESFQQNKNYYHERMEKERLPAVRDMLEQDCAHLDEMQGRLSTAREFYLVVHISQDGDVEQTLSDTEQRINEFGFKSRLAGRDDLKRILSVYYEQNVTSEVLQDYDGEYWLGKQELKRPEKKKRKRRGKPRELEKDFLDMIAPTAIRFGSETFLCGNTRRCVWALREYPVQTEEQALLRHLGEKNGVNLHIYTSRLSLPDENKIFENATNKNKLESNTGDVRQVMTARSNLEDIVHISDAMRKSGEPLVRCAVFIELVAEDMRELKKLQNEVQAELLRSKLNVDKLPMKQLEGFQSVCPGGYNHFGSQFERVLPASSVANLYPFNYSGKTDRHGFYIGKDHYGTNILVDFDQRDPDKTSGSILILGNSGQGKSHLMKHLIINFLESGKSVISLDTEHEQKDLCTALGGYFIDLMTGEYRINVLEPKCWNTRGSVLEAADQDAPGTFQKTSVLAQHISWLKDFFRAYKDFSDAHVDTIEILLARLYAEWNITGDTDIASLPPERFPILSDLYALIKREYDNYDTGHTTLYTKQLLQEVLLGINSMCVGSDALFFNGHTNVSSSRFLVFGVGGLDTLAANVKAAILFNILSYMSNMLLSEGNAVAALDELYLWLGNLTAVEYIRNCLKRVRKRNSAMLLASQNLVDFDQPRVREMTKPMFAIPPHQFLFNPGSIGKEAYMDMLQLEDSEYDLIHDAVRGLCLYKCGNERYYLEVKTPPYKQELFGEAGGK